MSDMSNNGLVGKSIINIANKLIELQSRVTTLEQQARNRTELDKSLAAKERTRLWDMQEAAKRDRWTIMVSDQGSEYATLAAHIKNPVKFHELVKHKVVRKQDGAWIVSISTAHRIGYTLIDTKGVVVI